MKSLRNLFMVAALIAIPAFGQELTSDITGTVTNGAGTPVSKTIEQYADVFGFTLYNMGFRVLPETIKSKPKG